VATIKASDVKAVAYIEGIRIEISAWSAKGGVSGISSCVLDVNPSKAARELAPGTHVALFSTDPIRSEVSSQEVDLEREFPLAERSLAPYPIERLDHADQRGYALIFEGFIVGTGYAIHAGGTRNVQLICKGLGHVWEQTQQYWSDMSANLGMIEQIITNNYSGVDVKWQGHLGIQSFVLGQIAKSYTPGSDKKHPKIEESTLVPTLKMRARDSDEWESEDQENFLEYFINIFEKFGNSCAFYSTERNRWRLTDRVMSVPSGESLRRLFAETTFGALYRGALQKVTGTTNLIQIVAVLLQMIQHDLAEVLAPSLTVSAPIKRGENGVAEENDDTGTIVRDLENPLACPGSVIIKPSIWAIPPPSCNVLFPDMLNQLSYQRMFAMEPTRQEAYPTPSIFDSNEQKYRGMVTWAPDVIASFVDLGESTNVMGVKKDKGSSTKDGEQPEGDVPKNGPWHFITNEEKFKGILFNNIGAFPAPGKLDKKEEPDEDMQGIQNFVQEVLDAKFLKSRYERRGLTVTGPLNVRAVPGFPVLVMDDSEAGMHLVGYLASVDHSASASGSDGTSYSILHPRYLDEEDLNAPKRGEDEDEEDEEVVLHTIIKGENVRKIVALYKTSLIAVLEHADNAWLYDANRTLPSGDPLPKHKTLKDEHYVHPGEVLTVPLVDMSKTSEYVVQRGDTMKSLAAKFGVEGGVETLRGENPKAEKKSKSVANGRPYLVVGDTIKIPGITPEGISEAARKGEERTPIIQKASKFGIPMSQFFREGSPKVPPWFANGWRASNPERYSWEKAVDADLKNAGPLSQYYRSLLGWPVVSCAYDGPKANFDIENLPGDVELWNENNGGGVEVLRKKFLQAAEAGLRAEFIDRFTRRRLVTIAELYEFLGCEAKGGGNFYSGGCFEGEPENFEFEKEKWKAMVEEAKEIAEDAANDADFAEKPENKVKVRRSRKIMEDLQSGRLSYPMTFEEVYRVRRERAMNYYSELKARRAFRG